EELLEELRRRQVSCRSGGLRRNRASNGRKQCAGDDPAPHVPSSSSPITSETRFWFAASRRGRSRQLPCGSSPTLRGGGADHVEKDAGDKFEGRERFLGACHHHGPLTSGDEACCDRVGPRVGEATGLEEHFQSRLPRTKDSSGLVKRHARFAGDGDR